MFHTKSNLKIKKKYLQPTYFVNLNHELFFKYTLSVLIAMVTALTGGQYINYYYSYNGDNDYVINVINK